MWGWLKPTGKFLMKWAPKALQVWMEARAEKKS